MCLSHPIYDVTTFRPAPFYRNYNLNLFLWRTSILNVLNQYHITDLFRAFLFAGIFALDHNIHVILNMIVLIMYHAWLITDSTLTSPLSLQVILNVVSYITWYIYHAWLITDSTLTSPLSLSPGISTMYLTMPMSAQALPVMGTCAVNDKKISLRFPLTNVSFDLPESPREGSTSDMEFKMSGARGYIVI